MFNFSAESVSLEPFPHLYKTNALPDSIFDALESQFPLVHWFKDAAPKHFSFCDPEVEGFEDFLSTAPAWAELFRFAQSDNGFALIENL